MAQVSGNANTSKRTAAQRPMCAKRVRDVDVYAGTVASPGHAPA